MDGFRAKVLKRSMRSLFFLTFPAVYLQAARGRDSRRAPEQEKILRVYATGDGSVLQGSQPVGMFTT